MTIVFGMDKLLSFDVRGKFGYSGGFGRLQFSYNRFGFHTLYAGIYQRKRYKKGKAWSRMAFYQSSNPRTVPQQNWRAILAAGWVIYGAFSDEEKMKYKELAKKKAIGGGNLFMRQWLQQYPCGFGKILFSYNRFGFY